MKYYLSLIATLFLTINISAITDVPPIKPSIVINLVLDDVSNEEIDRYSHLLSTDGLLKLRNEGTTFNNAFYPYASSNRACDYASLSTGTTPRHHGIVSNEWYLRDNNTFESAILNKQSHLLDSCKSSPGYDAKKLITTTLGDEFKLISEGKSKVFSISLDQTASVLLAGHAANGAYWMDKKSGKWLTSSSYMDELPEWVNKFNNMNFADFYLNQEWTLSEDINKNSVNEKSYTNHLFPLTLKNYIEKKSPYSIISSTPMGQLYLEDFAKAIIKNEELGKDEQTDLLYINYSSITDIRLYTAKYSLEKTDFLVRLDKSIAQIIKFLDKEIGNHRYLITLTSTKQTGLSVNELKEQKLPTGYFNPTRARALLNSYLMAIHGQGNWVLSINNQQLFLNKKLIEKSHLNLSDFTEQVAQFMEEFSGIKWAMPSSKLKYSDFRDEDFAALQAAYFHNRCGDVMLSYYPGWAEETNDKSIEYTFSQNNSYVPLIFYGWKTKRSAINSRTNITGLAPTISTLLGISMPNSSSREYIFHDLLEK